MFDRNRGLALWLAVIAGCGLLGCTRFRITVPAPSIRDLSPNAVTAGSPAFDLTINGIGFVDGYSEVRFGSVVYGPTQWTAPTPGVIVVRVAASYVATARQVQVTVINRPLNTDGGTTTADFTINNPVPNVTGVSTTLPPPNDQNFVPAGGPSFRMLVTGSGFASGSLIQWDGVARITNLLSANQLATEVSAADLAVSRTVRVSASNPAPGGGLSPTSVPFTVYAVSTVIPFLGIVPWFQTRVTFDDPPPASTVAPLNGFYPRPPSSLPPRLTFPAGQWEWAAELVNNRQVRDAFFSQSTAFPANSRTFSFANGPRILSSVDVITPTAGTVTLRDDTGRTKTQQIAVGPVQNHRHGLVRPTVRGNHR
jgi:hypothetical protein